MSKIFYFSLCLQLYVVSLCVATMLSDSKDSAFCPHKVYMLFV